jgi:abortive infection bacteriophage resistance protein
MFGGLSKLFSALALQHRKEIAQVFKNDEALLVSWLRCLTQFRNQCAHHERIWDRRERIDQPKAAKDFGNLMHDTRSFCSRAVILSVLMNALGYKDEWLPELNGWLVKRKKDQLLKMGFPDRPRGLDAVANGQDWLDDACGPERGSNGEFKPAWRSQTLGGFVPPQPP